MSDVENPRAASVLRAAAAAYPTALRRLWLLAFVMAVISELLYSFSYRADLMAGGAAMVAAIAVTTLLTGFMTARWLQLHGRLDFRPTKSIVVLAGALAVFYSLGIVALIVPMFVLAIMWAVAFPAQLLEGLGTRASLGRSRELVRGHWWTVIGVFTVTSLPFIAGMVPEWFWVAPDSLGSFAFRTALSTLANPFWAVSTVVLYDALSSPSRSLRG